MQDLLLAFGQKVRELRAKKGLSQEDFADVCGLHRTYMGAIERGERNLSFKNLHVIAKSLGLTLSQLLSGLEKRAEAVKTAMPRKRG